MLPNTNIHLMAKILTSVLLLALFVPFSEAQDKFTYRELMARPKPLTWIWQYNGSPLRKKADIHVLDGFDHSREDYDLIRKKGSFPVAYFSCSYESWRPDAKQWKESDKGPKMAGWDERWPSPSAIKDHNSNLWKIYQGRLNYFTQKVIPLTREPGSFAIEWDNVDLYSSIKLGDTEGLRFLKHLKMITERSGFVFVLKNSVEMIDRLPGVEMYVNEEAQQWGEIGAYSRVGQYAPVLNVEYKRPKSFPPYVYTIYYPSQNRIDGNAITFDNVRR